MLLNKYDIFVRPVMTEKSTLIGGSKNNTVIFEVAPKSTKEQIKNAAESIFNVKVDKVRVCNFMGKQKRVGTKVGMTNSFKKAYITLKEGHSIDIIEGL